MIRAFLNHRPAGPVLIPGALLALLLVLFAATVGTARAELPAQDRSFSHHLTLAGKQIPLPPGDWRVAGISSVVAGGPADHAAGAVIETLVLFLLRGPAVESFVVINTNALPADHGWGLAGACRRSDLYAAAIEAESSGDVFCRFAGHVQTIVDDRSAPAWRAAVRLANERGWRLPQTWLMAGFRIADRRDVVDVRYHFNPEPQGEPGSPPLPPVPLWLAMIPGASALVPVTMPALTEPPAWADSPWAVAHLGENAGRRNLADRLVRWSEMMRTPIEQGFRNQLADQPDQPMPWTAAADALATAAPDPRRQALDGLLAAGRLTPAQYQDQLAALAADPPTPATPDAGNGDGGNGDGGSGDSGGLWLLLAKTAGWRMTATTSSMLLCYLVTGNFVIAGSIAAVSTMVNGALYFGHEVLWQAATKPRTEPARTLDFADAGRL
jgi:uncharacterized membrane protein